MQILSLSIKNFKIHHDRYFEFQPGVNAICGENGAGKTSILEAIAWVLFHYTGSYNKDEIRRQGSTHTEVTVSFISPRDGRTYRVQKQMSKSKSGSYTIFDPQLNLKLDGINRVDDALQWLQDHLGLPTHSKLTPAKYLPKIFGEVIGIPQGTFTLDFLKTPEERKKVFDPILQVEEYKLAFQKTAEVEKYAESQVRQIQYQLQSYDDRLRDWPDLQNKQQVLQQECEQEHQQCQALQSDVIKQEQICTSLHQQAEILKELAHALQQYALNIEHQKQAYQQQQKTLENAQNAVNICNQTRSAYQNYLTLQQELRDLSVQRQERDRLTQQLGKLEQQRQQQQLQHTQLKTQLALMTEFQGQLAALADPLKRHHTLSLECQALIKKIEALKALEGQQKQSQKSQQRLQYQIGIVENQIADIQALAPIAAQQDNLTRQRDRLQQQLAHRQAALQFYQELATLQHTGEQGQAYYKQSVNHAQHLLRSLEEAVPLWTPQLQDIERTLGLGITLQGQQLEAVAQILQDLSAQVDEAQLQAELVTVEQQWQAAQGAQLQQAKLPDLAQQAQQYRQELMELQQQSQAWISALQELETLQQQHQALSQELKALGDPMGQAELLKRQLQSEPTLRQRDREITAIVADLETQIIPLQNRLAEYPNLEQEFQNRSQQLQTLEPDYRQYLQQEQLATTLPQQQAQAQILHQQLKELESDHAQQYEAYKKQEQEYSSDTLAAADLTYQQLRSQRDYLQGSLEGKQTRLRDLEQQLLQRQAWDQERQTLQQEYQTKQTVSQFLKDVRTIYNQSGPCVTRYYLDEIRQEADRLFRELMNRPGIALNWTEDYEIEVQEDYTWRGFRTLSGGEQTAAALAVRLALLKVIADLDVAFFDEPTVNLDKDRRESLAETLANLKSFRQLFVISHDDTFETLTENIIRVERSLS